MIVIVILSLVLTIICYVIKRKLLTSRVERLHETYGESTLGLMGKKIGIFTTIWGSIALLLGVVLSELGAL